MLWCVCGIISCKNCGKKRDQAGTGLAANHHGNSSVIIKKRISLVTRSPTYNAETPGHENSSRPAEPMENMPSLTLSLSHSSSFSLTHFKMDGHVWTWAHMMPHPWHRPDYLGIPLSYVFPCQIVLHRLPIIEWKFRKKELQEMLLQLDLDRDNWNTVVSIAFSLTHLAIPTIRNHHSTSTFNRLSLYCFQI